jgi:hypothetical protein
MQAILVTPASAFVTYPAFVRAPGIAAPAE